MEKCYVVTKLERSHRNHALIDDNLSKHYPKFRRVSQETTNEANKLLSYEVKAHKIKAMVASTGVVALSQDIQNLRYLFFNNFLKYFEGCCSIFI